MGHGLSWRGGVLALGLGLGLPAGAVSLEQHLAVCVACHGPGGNSVIPENPKLAGLQAEYIYKQLVQFKSGKRKHVVMSQLVVTIDDMSMNELSEYYSNQKRSPGKATDAALAARGKAIFEQGVPATNTASCASCHGNDGLGDAKYPGIAAQNVVYVERQLAAFKSGERANDLKGVMGAVARGLTDEQARAVAQYVASLKEE
jgi:cytochrome c553